MSNLYELLQKIKKNPSMYLGRKSILSFPPFWYGYTIAEDQFRIQADHQVMIQARRQERKFEDFLKWIREKYQVQTSQSWAKIILFYSEDERIAIDRFFERLSFKSS
ncbi:MAG TPA: hypothetical protein DEG17_05390, partial [Cyanobacteria bacterium UBA11149]|nr:hypothetical protein [Cyanobacteria bacterium UBA11366]HBS72072.1 hypothetical protein [Cyanobacteria bacterium UBA11153]HBW88316.1 hypothetical protein [Cyanobacteria bacterium UBA11149]